MTRLSLTFDNGPEPGTTERVLESLAERNLRATFFVVGQRLLTFAGRHTAARVREQGHRLGNHTMTHGAPLGEGAGRARVEAEIGGAQVALRDLAGDRLFFRPNGRGRVGPHLLSVAAVDYLVERRYTVVTWNSAPRDWEKPSSGWVARARRAIATHDWTVLALHDVHAPAVEHLPGFLDSVLADGVEIRDDFPPSCLPIVDGVIQPPLARIVTNAAALRQIKPG